MLQLEMAVGGMAGKMSPQHAGSGLPLETQWMCQTCGGCTLSYHQKFRLEFGMDLHQMAGEPR